MRRSCLLLAVFSAVSPGYSYSSPYVYGYTGNVVTGPTWTMSDVVPDYPSLDINAVIYQYTAVKDPADAMKVYIQNKDATGPGYIFQEIDDWTGKPGGSINKIVSINNIPIGRWGDGSIEIEGEGIVLNPVVVYSFRVDTSQGDNIINIDLPGIEIYNALDDDAVTLASTDTEQYQDEDQEEDQEKKERNLEAADNAVALAGAISIQALALGVNIQPYYAVAIPGGEYKDANVLVDSKLPENRKGLRNGLAQQVLHQKMVLDQYKGDGQ